MAELGGASCKTIFLVLSSFTNVIDLPQVQKELQIARGFGDFSENAELDCAKDKEKRVLSEISRIESILPRLVVPPYKNNAPYVRFAAYVSWKNENNESIRYRIVGTEESNLSEGKISLNSIINKYGNDVLRFTLLRFPRIGEDAEININKFQSCANEDRSRSFFD